MTSTKNQRSTSYMALLRSAIWYGPSAINIALLRSEEMTFAFAVMIDTGAPLVVFLHRCDRDKSFPGF